MPKFRWIFYVILSKSVATLDMSDIEVRVKRTGPSGLGDLEVTEYIAPIRSVPFEREDDASVHLATTEATFMPD